MSECTHPYLKKNTKSKSRLTLVLLTVDKTDSPFSQPSSLGGPLTKFFLSLMNPEEKGEGGAAGGEEQSGVTGHQWTVWRVT